MATLPDFNGDVKIMAASNDADEFVGLLVDSLAGLFVRADQEWHTVGPNNPTFVGVSLHYLDPDAVAFYDKIEAKGKEPTLDQMLAFADEDEEPVLP